MSSEVSARTPIRSGLELQQAPGSADGLLESITNDVVFLREVAVAVDFGFDRDRFNGCLAVEVRCKSERSWGNEVVNRLVGALCF